MSQSKTLQNGLQLAGLRPRTRLLASSDDNYGHDRLLLARVHGTVWVVATPHYDVYIIDLGDYADTHPQGPRGVIAIALQDRPRVRFIEIILRGE